MQWIFGPRISGSRNADEGIVEATRKNEAVSRRSVSVLAHQTAQSQAQYDTLEELLDRMEHKREKNGPEVPS
jgi:hypothetical protein